MTHLKAFLANSGVTLLSQDLQVTETNEIPGLLQGAGDISAVRLDFELSTEWVSASPVQSLIVSQLGAADLMFHRNGQWEPELLFEQAVRESIVRHGRTLDLKSSAYVIGSGHALTALGAVCLGLGFQKLCLVHEIEEADTEENLKVLQGMYRGAVITPLPAHQLTLQTVGSSLMINSSDLTDLPDLLADLSYFNFMCKDGVVMDLAFSAANRSMLEEARRAGLRVLPALDADGMANWLFLKGLGLADRFRVEDYLRSWESFVNSLDAPAEG